MDSKEFDENYKRLEHILYVSVRALSRIKYVPYFVKEYLKFAALLKKDKKLSEITDVLERFLKFIESVERREKGLLYRGKWSHKIKDKNNKEVEVSFEYLEKALKYLKERS